MVGMAPRFTPVEQMPVAQIRIDGQPMEVRLAQTSAHKAQGFQGADAQTLAEEMIYFSWQIPKRPSFHMRNVKSPLAIAWIDAEEHVVGVDIMEPEESGYRPPLPVNAALELAPQRAESLGIGVGSTIERE